MKGGNVKNKKAKLHLGVIPSANLHVLFGSVIILLAFCGPLQAQRITAVEPTECQAGSSLTISGEELGKNTIKGVILSSNGTSYPAEITGKADDKITVKVPNITPGTYKLGLKVGSDTYVDPVEVTVK